MSLDLFLFSWVDLLLLFWFRLFFLINAMKNKHNSYFDHSLSFFNFIVLWIIRQFLNNLSLISWTFLIWFLISRSFFIVSNVCWTDKLTNFIFFFFLFDFSVFWGMRPACYVVWLLYDERSRNWPWNTMGCDCLFIRTGLLVFFGIFLFDWSFWTWF